VSVADRLEGKRVCICVGSGGVGKTTTSAAIALGLAAGGARVAVVTIDPAKRLAQSLGLQELGNEPRRVDPGLLTSAGLDVRGELWAMMLDPKRTFDDLVARLAPDERTRDEVLANRIYQELSGAVAGSQEFTAVAKLYDLHRDGGFDVIVLDTPPSRNALDFLDAPDRLTGFLEGKALQALIAPTGFATRIVGRSTGVVFSILKRVTGVDLLDDLALFFRSLGGLTEGFRERARGVKELLADPATTFLIVTSPEPEPVEEAIFFHGRLADAGLPFGGAVVNRAHTGPDTGGDVAVSLVPVLGDRLAARVAQTATELTVLAERDAQTIARLTDTLGGPPPIVVPLLDGDVHDVPGLARLLPHLFGGPSAGGDDWRGDQGLP
jgi:anion-transporting  ArsA/GET3 family ATPase